MAKIGLNNFRFGILTEGQDGTPSYGGAIKPAKAISCTVDISNNEAVLYADDGVAESDTSFQSGTVTIGIDDEDQETMATMLGHSVDEQGEMVRNANDTAPYIGLGRIIVKMINNVRKYKVEFLYKVKFGEPSQEDNTQGESLEFATSEMEGQVATLANGDWSKSKTFDTKAEALTYLEGLLGGAVPASTTYTVTYNVNGGTGTVAAVEATAGSIITLNNGSGITPPTGKVFAGWDTTATATSADLTGSYVVNGNVTLYAIYIDE